MLTAEAHQLLKQGISTAKAGDVVAAREILTKATEISPESPLAWIWLAGVTESPADMVTYLRHALEIDPTNKHAVNGLKWAEEKLRKTVPERECPFCETVFTQQDSQCPDCQAILSLADPKVLLHNGEVDQARVMSAIKHYEGSGVLSDADNFTQHFNLGVGYLNLKQITKGVTHLKSALGLRPADETLSAQLALLLEQPEVIAAQTWEVEPPAQTYLGTVLIVDDSPTVQKLVTFTLERQNYQVISANDGFEALARLGDATPDLILLDITMPKMDGYQVCKIVRENNTTREIPVVMLSSKDGFFDKVRGRMAGSTDYITKPFQPDALLKVMQKYLS